MKQAAGLLAVDIDGTLITDHGSITYRVHEALARAVSSGWEIVLASGRTYHAAHPVIEQLPFLTYSVVSNGACILNVREMKVVHLASLDPEVVRTVVDAVRDNGAIPALYTTECEHQRIYYDTLEGACENFRWYIENDPRAVRVEDVAAVTDDILQIGLVAKKAVIEHIRDGLEGISATVMTLPYESTHIGGKSRDHWFMQVVAPEARKNIALRRMAERLNIPRGRIVAVGDNFNDADMIAGADIGVAMGNAPEEIKRLARIVVASNNHSGLAEAVDEIILSGTFFS